MKTATSLFIAVIFMAAPAHAFDCARASTKVEKAICASPELKTRDDAMTTAYGEIKALSTPAEQKMLARSQKAWIAGREGACANSAGTDLTSCITDEIKSRLDQFEVKAESGPGPASPMIPVFVVQEGGKGVYALDYSLMRFADPKTEGERKFNAFIARIVSSAPLGRQKDHPNDENLDYSADVTLSYASPKLVSAMNSFGGDEGGAHPNGGTENINIDMVTGKEVEIGGVLPEAAAAKLEKDCKKQIIAQKREKNDGENYDLAKDEFLKEDVIAEHIATMSRWTLKETEATVTFDPYAIGPYTEEDFECTFPMKELKAMALPGAPLPWAD